MNRKTFASAGMAVSALIVIFGILFIAGALSGSTGLAGSAGAFYDSGYASFGADFYTYVSNNAAEAASAGRVVASNLDDIFHLAKAFGGIFLIGFGLLGLCYFGMKRTECKGLEKVKTPEAATEVPGAPWTEPETDGPDTIVMEESWISEPAGQTADAVTQAVEEGEKLTDQVSETVPEAIAAEE